MRTRGTALPNGAMRCAVCGDWFLWSGVRPLINLPSNMCEHYYDKKVTPEWEMWWDGYEEATA